MTGRIIAFTLLLLALPFALVLTAQDDAALDDLLDKAEKFVSRGQWSRAITPLEQILAKSPKDEDAAHHLVLAYEAIGRWQERIALAERFAAEFPASREWRLALTDALRAVGRDDDAKKGLVDFVAKNGPDFLLEATIGDIDESRGRTADAEKIFTELVKRGQEIAVTSAWDLTGLGRADRFFRDGKPNPADAAADCFIEAKKKDKKFVRAREELAFVHARLRDRWSDVKAEYRDLLEIRPRWPAYLMGYVLANEIHLEFDEMEARQKLTEALAINASYPPALFEKGMQELGDAMWASARARFEKALGVNPNDLDNLSGMAAWAYLVKDMATYETYVKKVLERRPNYGRVHQIVAKVLNERRRWPESLEQMKKAVAIDPNDPRLFDDLGRYAFYLGLEDEGKKALEHADKISPLGRAWRNNMQIVAEKIAEYKERKSEHFVVRIPKTESDVFGRHVIPFLERSYAEYKERYGLEPGLPILVEIFPKHDDFAVRTLGTMGLGALGVCFGPTIFMDSPKAQKSGTYNWASTAHHELAHVFTLALSRGRTPRWLTEGLSTWEEVRRDPAWGRHMEELLADALASDEIFGVLDFDSGFHGPRIIFAYYQGGVACEWIEKTFGLEKIRKMLALYGEDLQTPAVLKEALGMTPDEFDRRFKEYVATKLAPLKRIPNLSDDKVTSVKAEIAAGKDVVENRIRLLWAYHRRGSAIDADAVLKELLDAKVADPRIEFYLGMRARAGKALDLAEKHLKAAVQGGLVDADLYRALAEMAEAAKDTPGALAFWEKAELTDPWQGNPGRSAKLALARLKKAAGDLPGYYAKLDEMRPLLDTAVDLRWELLKDAQAKKDDARAMKLLDEVLWITPYDPKLYESRAELHESAGRKEALIADLETALDLATGDTKSEIKIRVRLGKTLLDLGKTDDAVYHLERVLEMDPENAAAREALNRVKSK